MGSKSHDWFLSIVSVTLVDPVQRLAEPTVADRALR
jgi:hypothetical protein